MRKAFIAIVPAALLAVAALLPAAAPAASPPAPDGAALFRQRCQSCHSITPGQRAVLAPNLSGVIGRKAGTSAFNNSPALAASNIVWNRARLDTFLAAPGRMVPGTRMVIAVSDPAQRAAIVAHLNSIGK